MTGGYGVRMLGTVVWTTVPQLVATRRQPAETSSTGCAQEKVGHFLGKLSTAISPQESPDILWKTVATGVRATVEKKWLTRIPAAARRAGYPSPVCSILGDAIDQIAAAIDELARDVQEGSGSAQHTARVADIWLMVAALDPELSRRMRHYTAPTDPADDVAAW
jgi:hypothetical protein